MTSSIRSLLGIESTAAELDPAGLGQALGRLAVSVAGNPAVFSRSAMVYGIRSAQAAMTAVLRGMGVNQSGPAEPTDDPRFADPAWTSNPLFYLVRQQHMLLEGFLRDLLAEADLDEVTRRKADFALRQVLDAAAPTNWLATNPVALKRAFETGGLSLVRGAGNALRDLATNKGMPRQVTPGQFRPGHELAATPGSVVFRNRLIELIQYEPQTQTVHTLPLLFSPPWINKYYIMDLAPGKSLVEWAVRHGHTCFMISYRNPDETLAELTMSDYLREGPLTALEVVEEITGTQQTNLAGLCLGGTMAAAMLAWLAARGEDRIHSLTVMNTLLDFTLPGQLGVFTDEAAIQRLDRTMARKGYLPADSMATTFNLLRARHLVWNYVVNNWLLGEEPAPFDILSWNSDSIRMASAMQTEYTRSLYLENRLAKGELTLAGQQLDLARISQDSYFVSAERDHIALWKAVYASARLMGGTVRFMLSNSGHIAGVVNPPNPKSRHWVGSADTLPEDPEAWRRQAAEVAKSWWEDWTPWIAGRAGRRRKPPPMGSITHPPLAAAPGSYVREK
ncbi:MAG: alpha/beta fold hydrolase [Pseudonocardiales bacterium]|nr:alpha/beta fold hydrolase [Pseudonocardiales bacterium]MBW0009190.1 alpha/beta fold hydrolase [Pseudonocardiales bacterium]